MASSMRADWAWSLAADMLMRLVPVIAVLVYFPLLGAEVAGTVLIALSYVTALYLIVDLGLGLYGTRGIAEGDMDPEALHAEITVARAILLIPITALLIWVLNVVVGTSFLTALAFGGYLAARGVSADWRLRGESRFRTFALINFVAGGVQLALLPFVTAENWQSTVALPWLVAGVIMLVGTWRATGVAWAKMVAALTVRSLRHLARSYRFSLVSGIMTVVHQSPVIFLSFVYASGEMAGFAFTHRIALFVTLLSTALGHALFPRLVKAAKTPGPESWLLTLRGVRAIGLMLILLAPLALLPLLIGELRTLYFPGVTLITFAALGLFAVSDSIRVLPMQLGFAWQQESRVMVITVTALAVHILALSALYLTGQLTIEATSVVFMVTGLGIFAGMMALARRISKQDKAPNRDI
ncbi:MAG: hypothetical protein AAF666_04825 [Pseudomonadota bacterium]